MTEPSLALPAAAPPPRSKPAEPAGPSDLAESAESAESAERDGEEAMPDDAPGSADADADTDASTDAGTDADTDASTDTDSDTGSERAPGLPVMVALGLVWLVATAWSAHALVAADTVADTVIVSTAALVLPAVIAASLLAGVAAGLTAVTRWAASRMAPRRAAIGTAAGALVGLVTAAAVYLPDRTAPLGVLAITIGASGTIGGALAVLRPAAAVAAGIAATLADFAVGTLLGYFQAPLKPIFGGGDTVESRLAAAHWYSLTAALISGVVAGLFAFGYLRQRAPGLRWPAYLLAGAWPGLLAVLAEVLTRGGSGPLLSLIGRLDPDSGHVNEYLGSARLNSVMVVGFVGAIVAIVAFGTTLRSPDVSPEPDEPDEGVPAQDRSTS